MPNGKPRVAPPDKLNADQFVEDASTAAEGGVTEAASVFRGFEKSEAEAQSRYNINAIRRRDMMHNIVLFVFWIWAYAVGFWGLITISIIAVHRLAPSHLRWLGEGEIDRLEERLFSVVVGVVGVILIKFLEGSADTNQTPQTPGEK